MKKYLKRLLSMMMAVLLCFGIVPCLLYTSLQQFQIGVHRGGGFDPGGGTNFAHRGREAVLRPFLKKGQYLLLFFIQRLHHAPIFPF